MKVLDLFSGIGGFSLGLERAGMETIAFCEIEEFPRQVLKKHWPNIPIAGDIRKLSYNRKTQELTFDGAVIYVGPIDLICGGYPCQPFSTAGKRKGKEDDRHLWPEYLRLIREIRPRWVIGENVAGHISMGLDAVLSDLEGEGYAWETFVIPAVAVDAPHRRDRVWIVANSEGVRYRQRGEAGNIFEKDGGQDRQMLSEPGLSNPSSESLAHSTRSNDRGGNTGEVERQSREFGNSSGAQNLADSDSDSDNVQGVKPRRTDSEEWTIKSERQAGSCGDGFRRWPAESRMGGMDDGFSPWLDEPDTPRVAKGIPDRVNRLKGLGNAVVPQIPEIIGRAIMNNY